MKTHFALLAMILACFNACTTGLSPTANPSATQIPPETAIPTPAPATSTPAPSPTATLRPTIDLALVLTPQVTVEYEVDYIPLKTSDNVQLMAKQFGQGEPVVILLHQGTWGANQRDWEAFARMIAARGFSAATLDFRGRGHSKGDITQTYNLIWDLQALMEHLQGKGLRRFVCMGASMGGSTCLRAAVDYDLEGIVVIGSYLSNGPPTSTSMEELAALSMPKLFITTEQDVNREIPSAVREMYHIAQEPKQLQLFPGEAHGTEMFNEAYGEEFTALLMAFLEALR